MGRKAKKRLSKEKAPQSSLTLETRAYLGKSHSHDNKKAYGRKVRHADHRMLRRGNVDHYHASVFFAVHNIT